MIYYLWTKSLSRAEPRDIKQSQKDAPPNNEASSAQDWFFLHNLQWFSKAAFFRNPQKMGTLSSLSLFTAIAKSIMYFRMLLLTFWVEVNKYLSVEIYKVQRNNILSILC